MNRTHDERLQELVGLLATPLAAPALVAKHAVHSKLKSMSQKAQNRATKIENLTTVIENMSPVERLMLVKTLKERAD